jgi:ssDNA-binding Zn-finger/Zn-ribbon topoisomerase 1
MARRVRGSDGATFWGCSRFPKCWGTREATAIELSEPVKLLEPETPASAETTDTVEVQRRKSTSVAGESARAEFERRSQRDRERLRRARPALLAFGGAIAVVGLLLTAFGPTPPGPGGPISRLFYLVIVMAAVVATPVAMFALPASTVAWRTGAIGEERTGELLGPLEAEGFRIIHDRLIPRSRANIDHIVVGPPGIFIVETKNYTGKLSRGRKEQFAAQAKREAAAVAGVVSPVPVTPLICVHRADLGWFKVRADGVRIVSPRELIKVLRKAPMQLTPDEAASLADRIDKSLVPAVGRRGGPIAGQREDLEHHEREIR